MTLNTGQTQNAKQPDAPAVDDLVLEVESGRLAHGLHNLEDAHALAAPEVVRLVARLGRAVVERLRLGCERVEGEQVALGEVKDVQVVPHACAVAVIGMTLAGPVLNEKVAKLGGAYGVG